MMNSLRDLTIYSKLMLGFCAFLAVVIAAEAVARHERAFPGSEYSYPELDPGGLYQWRLSLGESQDQSTVSGKDLNVRGFQVVTGRSLQG